MPKILYRRCFSKRAKKSICTITALLNFQVNYSYLRTKHVLLEITVLLGNKKKSIANVFASIVSAKKLKMLWEKCQINSIIYNQKLNFQ